MLLSEIWRMRGQWLPSCPYSSHFSCLCKNQTHHEGWWCLSENRSDRAAAGPAAVPLVCDEWLFIWWFFFSLSLVSGAKAVLLYTARKPIDNLYSSSVERCVGSRDRYDRSLGHLFMSFACISCIWSGQLLNISFLLYSGLFLYPTQPCDS